MALVIFLTATLVFSCVGMTVLLSLKRWELATGRVIFSNARLYLNLWSHRAIDFMEHRLPGHARVLWMYVLYQLRGSARAALARGLLSLEHTLESVLHFLRHGIVPRQDGKNQASAFLQEVSEHKKRLMRRSRERRALGRIPE